MSAGIANGERVRASKKEIFGWAMFDFANQAYTLLIITVVFGDLFTRVIVGDAPDYRWGNFLWSLALAISYAVVVVLSPIAGAMMDYRAEKKKYLFLSYVLTVLATAALYFVAPGYAWLGVVLLVLSNFGYSIGEAFIASFLPSLGPPEDLGKISGFGWALGYVGGMASAVFVLLVLGEVSLENFERIRWVGPWAAFFFFVTAIPTFLWVREPGKPRPLPAGVSTLTLGFQQVKKTMKSMTKRGDLELTLVSTFFSMSGIYIVITYAFIYGAQVIGWEESVRTWMFIIVQITAALGAFLFGFVQDRRGTLYIYRVTLLLWIIAISLIYWTPELAEKLQALTGRSVQAQHVFLVVGCVAGFCLGSCQSATRTLVGILSPYSRAAEYFGFWGLSMKLAGMAGLLLIGLLQALIGLKSAILFCVVLFGVAFLLSLSINESRGKTFAETLDKKAREE